MSDAPIMPGPTTRRERREESRLAVLTEAAALFSKGGFHGVALDDISAACGVRKNNLLYHFSSKEELWKETVDWVFAQADAFFEQARAAQPAEPWLGFESFVRTYFEACRRFPAYVLVPMLEGVNTGWRADYIAERHLRRHVGTFDRYVRTLIDEGVLAPIEPLHLQNMLTGGAQLFLSLAPLWNKAIDTDTQDPAFIETYAQSVLALIRANRPDLS